MKAPGTRRITRGIKMVKAKTLDDKWALLSRADKRYASHLVRDLGWPVRIAIEHAYIIGFDCWTYDFRLRKSVRETCKASRFGY